MDNPCIVNNYPALAARHEELVKQGVPDRDAAIKAATEEHKVLYNELKKFKKSIGVANVEYIPFDASKKIQEVHDKYNPLIENIKNDAKAANAVGNGVGVDVKTKEQTDAQGRVDGFVNGLSETNPELHKLAATDPIAALNKLIDHHKEMMKGADANTKAYSQKAIDKFEALKKDHELANSKIEPTPEQHTENMLNEAENMGGAFAQLAKLIRDKLKGVNTNFVDKLTTKDGKQAWGVNSKKNGITLSKEAPNKVQTFLHEAIHQLTSMKITFFEKDQLHHLTDTDLEALNELNRIYHKTKGLLEKHGIDTNYNVFSNLSEFVAEAMANPEFQGILSKFKAEGKSPNIFKQFLDAVAKMLGIKDPTILDDIFHHTEKLIEGDKPKEQSLLSKDQPSAVKLAEPITTTPILKNEETNNNIKPEAKASITDQTANSNIDQTIETTGNGGKEPPIINSTTGTPYNSEEWSSIRKYKQREIKAVQESYDNQKVKGWSETMKIGLEKTQAAHPGKTLYDAALTTMHNIKAGLGHGDMSIDEALATMSYLKREINAKRAKLADAVTSDNSIIRDTALFQDEAFDKDYTNTALAIKDITTTAGRTLNFAQSEIRLDPEHGLQIRRMQFMKAKGGEALTPEEMQWTKDKWAEEQDIAKREAILREEKMKEDFDNRVADMQKQYEDKLNKVSTNSKTTKLTIEKRKSVADSIRKAAENFEKFGKAKGAEGAEIQGVDIKKMIADGMRYVADKIEEGKLELPDIITNAIIKYGKGNESELKKKINEELLNAGIDESLLVDRKKAAIDKIKKFAKENETKEITNDMVGKGLIRDYVNSHIGDVEQKDILDVATKDLQKILPDLTKEKLIEAYLKENEFKQPTKKDLEGGIAEQKKQLQNIAKTTEDIEDLKGLKEIRQRSFPNKRAKSEAEQELLNKKAAKIKEIKERNRAIKEDNARIESERNRQLQKVEDLKSKKSKLEQGIRDKKTNIPKVDTPEIEKLKKGVEEADKNLREAESLAKKMTNDIHDKKDKIAELDAGIKRAIDGYDQIKAHKNKSEVEIDEEIKSKTRELKRAINDNTSDEKVQEKLLDNAKKNTQRKIDDYKKKLAENDFEEPKPPTKLNKKDAGLIELEKQKNLIEDAYREKQREVQKKETHPVMRALYFARNVYVASLIGMPKTLVKVASSAILRPTQEGLRRATFGKIFDAYFPGISKVALRGGESSSWRSLKTGYEAYFRQYSPEQLELKYDNANKEFEAARKNYIYFKNSGPANAKETLALKNKMDDALIKVQGSFIYKFMGGSSLKDALSALTNRANEIEKQFGHETTESIKNGDWLDKTDYIIGFIGRSHSALKTFSGRFSFAAGFMARLEGAVANGEDISSNSKIIEIAHESYLDWQRGKYQQSNMISDWWSKLVNSSDKDKTGLALALSTTAKLIAKTDVAITRVPINMFHESLEYTFGAFRVLGILDKLGVKDQASIPRLMKEAKLAIAKDGFTNGTKEIEGVTYGTSKEEFKNALREQINKMDEKQAAIISRCFSKGGIGIGLYAFALISGAIHFGIFPHLGQKKKKEEKDLKSGELNPGQVMIGDTRYGEIVSSIMEHNTAASTMFMGLGLSQAYNDEINKGKTTAQSVGTALYTHLKIWESDIPQTKILSPTKAVEGIIQLVKKRATDTGIIDPDAYKGFSKTQIESEDFKYVKEKGLKLKPPPPRQADPNKPNFEKEDEYNNFIKLRADIISNDLKQLRQKGLENGATDENSLQDEVEKITEKANERANKGAITKEQKVLKKPNGIKNYKYLKVAPEK